MFNGRRQPSRDGTSRMTREYQVRFCERLGVKFPGPTRQKHALPHCNSNGRFTSISGHKVDVLIARRLPTVWRDGTGARDDSVQARRYIISPPFPQKQSLKHVH